MMPKHSLSLTWRTSPQWLLSDSDDAASFTAFTAFAAFAFAAFASSFAPSSFAAFQNTVL
jgi:hypothetical protein